MATMTVEGNVVNISGDFDNPYTPVDTVLGRFEETLSQANAYKALLVGEDGTSGFLGDIKSSLSAAPVISVIAPSVDTAVTLESTGLPVPTFDSSLLATFPTNSASAPVLGTLPEIDVDFSGITEPEDITSYSLSWSEATLPTDVYNAIVTKIVADIQNGSTGLNEAVEQAIYDRAKARQLTDRVAEWDRINNMAGELQFAYPSGVLLSAYTDYGMSANSKDTDIENQIIVAQGDLAQKNGQFTIQQAIALEGMHRQTREGESNRNLDAAKAILSAQFEAGRLKLDKFIAIWEGRGKKIQAESAALQGEIERQKGLVDIYREQIAAFGKEVDAVGSQNKNVTDVYLGEVQGFGEAERAVAARNDSAMKLLEQKIQDATMQLSASVAQAEQTVSAYTAHSSIQERISTALAQIVSNLVASMMSAVHAGATLGYSGSESSSKQVSMHASLGENHSYEHDPVE